MFSLVPEKTGRITQSRTLMNAHCEEVERQNVNMLAPREEIKSDRHRHSYVSFIAKILYRTF